MRAPINAQPEVQSQAGFFLIHVAIIIIAAGFMIAVAIPMFDTYQKRNAVFETEKRMSIITKAVASYVQARWRIPCPASSQAQSDTLFGVERASCTGAPANKYGILPYRTLGIPEQYAKDGYGNYFTYVVSPDFTATIPFNSNNNVSLRLVHAASGDKYALLPLAQFCAPVTSIAADIVVEQDGESLFSSVGRVIRNVNRPIVEVDANLHREEFVSAVAFALISHGANKYGSFQDNGTQYLPSNGGAAEDVTADLTNSTIELEGAQIERSNQNNEYDDIVRFFTQEQIMGLAGGGSCENL